jgi:plastocyanin
LAVTNAAIVVLLEGEAAGQSEPVPQTFTIEGYGFEPRFAIVSVGATVKLKNLDGRQYSCWATGANEFQFNDLAAGATVEQKLSSAGAVEVRCQRYPFMRLNLLVISKAVFTIADANGNFAFKNVPVGNYQASVYSNGSFCCGTAVKVQPQPMELTLSPLTKPPSSEAPISPPTDQAKAEPTKPTTLNSAPSQSDHGIPEPGNVSPGKSAAGTPEIKPAPPKPQPAKPAPTKQATTTVTQPPQQVDAVKPAPVPVKDKSPPKVTPEKKPPKTGGEAGGSLFKNAEPEIEIEE